MEKIVDRGKRVGLHRQEAYSSCQENTIQYHLQLCQYTTHGQFRWNKRDSRQIYHKPVPQRLNLLQPTGRHLLESHL